MTCPGRCPLMTHESPSLEAADPYVDPNHPIKVTFEEVKAARERIKGKVKYTPCDDSHFSKMTGMEIFLKKEFLQYTGSFKERGAINAMLQMNKDQRQRGVVASSLGNHAQAVCYHGQRLGIPVTVCMPIRAPIMKIKKCKEFGADVVVEGQNLEDAKHVALKLSKERGLLYINPYDHPHVIAGQGTIGLEIMDQLPDADAVVVPIGGGGLISGISTAVKGTNPKITIIGVEPERAQTYKKSKEAGKPTFYPVGSTVADGLAVSLVGYNAWETSKDLIDKLVVVTEEWIALAMLRFIENEKCVVEGAGVTGLAAILSGQLEELKGKKVVLVLSGGNIDTSILGRCLERGLAGDGRLVKLKVTVSDRPGGFCELCKVITSIGVSIRHITHERAWVTTDIFSVEALVICETRDIEHTFELKEAIKSKFEKCEFEHFPLDKSNSQ